MTREMTCILCPMGCRLKVMQELDGKVLVFGNTCKRGEQYGIQELAAPMRVVTSSVRVHGSRLPLCPVKTKGQLPKASIAQALEEIRQIQVEAPITIGQVLLPDVAGSGISIVATANRDSA